MCLLVWGEKQQQINKYSTCWKITQLKVIILKQILEVFILCHQQTKCAVEFGQQLYGTWQLQAHYSYMYTFFVAHCTWCHWIKQITWFPLNTVLPNGPLVGTSPSKQCTCFHALIIYIYVWNIQCHHVYVDVCGAFPENVVFLIDHKRSLLSNDRGPQSTHAESSSNVYFF